MNSAEHLLDLEWLWANKTMVHYFGLGFIQLKLDYANRVHFYTDKLPRTVEQEEVHDHRYNFVSTILTGMLSQEIYELDYSGEPTHHLVKESCQPGGKDFEQERIGCRVVPVFHKLYPKGDSYFIDHNTFHRVDSKDAITHVKRGSYQKDLANVAYPIGFEPTCPFSVSISQDEIFDILGEIIRDRA